MMMNQPEDEIRNLCPPADGNAKLIVAVSQVMSAEKTKDEGARVLNLEPPPKHLKSKVWKHFGLTTLPWEIQKSSYIVSSPIIVC